MGLPTRYLVPYEFRILGRDTKSGKPVSNIFFFRTKLQSAGAPMVYGDQIPTSNNETWSDHVGFTWKHSSGPISILSEHYEQTGTVARALMGKRWRTPIAAITAIVPLLAGGCSVTFDASLGTGFAAGKNVYMFGIASPSNMNGIYPIAEVINSREIRLTQTPVGTWGGVGSIQLATGRMDWLYGDKEEDSTTDVGDIAGEAMPLFTTASVRRLNVGTGRNWKSRVSLSPLGESQGLNGKLTDAAITAINAAFAVFLVGATHAYTNGGTGVGDANTMEHIAVSKQLAFLTLSPFVESDTWAKLVTSFAVRQNNGSFTKRKPKLTSVIAS